SACARCLVPSPVVLVLLPPSLPPFFFLLRPPPTSTLFPYTTLFRSQQRVQPAQRHDPAPGLAGGDLHQRSISPAAVRSAGSTARSEEHTSELQSRRDLVCRLLLEKKKHKTSRRHDAVSVRWDRLHC